MKNPNENIRIAHIDAFAPIGIPVWAKKVPKDETIPPLYILINSQSKNLTAVDKDGFEWLCTITFDITSLREPGYSKPVLLDDVEQQMITIIETEILIPDFINKEHALIDSRDLDSETESQSIERRILTYQYWVNNVD